MTDLSYLLLALLVVSVALNGWLVWRVLRPVRRLAAETAKLAQGDLTALEQPHGGIHEIDHLRHTMSSMTGHVRRAQADGKTYRSALTDGQEAERARIAHELHDDAMQAFVAVAQSIELALSMIDNDPARSTTLLNGARAHAVESVESLRRLIADLRPPMLAELGTAAALEMLARQNSDVPVEFTATGVERRIPELHELALFRVAQEAVRNARRHGQPRRITFDLAFQPQDIRLVVSDDGAGFEPPSSLDVLAQQGHFGLIGMQERVQQLNGTLTVNSKPGAGTRIDVVLPLSAVNQPAQHARDPVCGAELQPEQAYGSTEYAGEQYYFCCPVCQGAFQRQPALYSPGEPSV